MNIFKRSHFSWEIFLEILIDALFLAAVFIVPLWFSYLFPTYHIHEFSKLALIRLFIWPLAILTIVRLIISHSGFSLNHLVKRYFFQSSLILLLVIGLSCLFSVDPAAGFWGSLERQAGWRSWFYLIFFAFLLFVNLNLKGKKCFDDRLAAIITAAGFSATIVAIYGLLQIVNIDFVSWSEPPYLTMRTVSTFGQPNFLASWLLLVFPLNFYLFRYYKNFYGKFFWSLSAFFQLSCLFMTGSRSAILVLVLAVLSFLAIAAVKKWRRIFASKRFLAAALVFLLAVLLYSSFFLKNFGSRASSLEARSQLFGAAVSGIIEAPFFGHGSDSGQDIFIKYYSRDWASFMSVGQSADRAHNFILDALLSFGFLGLASLLFLYFGFFILTREARYKQQGLSIFLSLGVLFYLVFLLFNFSTVGSEFYFWIYLAILAAIVNEGAVDYKLRRRSLWIIALLLVSVVSFEDFRSIYRESLADYYFKLSIANIDAGQPLAALENYQALENSKTNDYYQKIYGRSLAMLLLSDINPNQDLSEKTVFSEELKNIEHLLPLSENDYRGFLALANIQSYLGQYSLAEDSLNQVFTISPLWTPAYLEAGRLALLNKNYQKAEKAYNLALMTLPEISDNSLDYYRLQDLRVNRQLLYSGLGETALVKGDFLAAAANYRLAYNDNPSNLVFLKKAADSYYLAGDFASAIIYLRHGQLRSPNDYNWPLAIALLLQEKGDQALADSYFKEAVNLGWEGSINN